MNTYTNLKTVRTIYSDLKGSGEKQKVTLTGVPLEKDDNYMESLQLIIETEYNKKQIFNLEDSGSEFNIFSVNTFQLLTFHLFNCVSSYY